MRIDGNVADVINQRKDDFYDEYSYLKPESLLEKIWNSWKSGLKKVGQWCREHWQEIFITMTIVIGAVLAIAAVIATGGLALVPILTTALTILGVSAGTAMTIATVISLTTAGIAILSTVGSSALNIVDIWCKIDNPILDRKSVV